jgi:hypothetical protein
MISCPAWRWYIYVKRSGIREVNPEIDVAAILRSQQELERVAPACGVLSVAATPASPLCSTFGRGRRRRRSYILAQTAVKESNGAAVRFAFAEIRNGTTRTPHFLMERTMQSIDYTTRTNDEISELGSRILREKIEPSLPKTESGKFDAVDVDSGQFEVDGSDLQAVDRLRGKAPGATIFLGRVGSPLTFRTGRRG